MGLQPGGGELVGRGAYNRDFMVLNTPGRHQEMVGFQGVHSGSTTHPSFQGYISRHTKIQRGIMPHPKFPGAHQNSKG